MNLRHSVLTDITVACEVVWETLSVPDDIIERYKTDEEFANGFHKAFLKRTCDACDACCISLDDMRDVYLKILFSLACERYQYQERLS